MYTCIHSEYELDYNETTKIVCMYSMVYIHMYVCMYECTVCMLSLCIHLCIYITVYCVCMYAVSSFQYSSIIKIDS